MKRKKPPGKSAKDRYTEWACDRPRGHRGARGASLVEHAKTLGYSDEEIRSVPGSAVMGLGCGNPTALAHLKEGETVLDLGSGGGLDGFLAARKVGPKGRVIGLDATPAMVQRSSEAAAKGGYANVEFRLAEIEHLPAADQSIDVIISNCVMNHCADKAAAFREAFRVLRPGGRLLVSDLVTRGNLPAPDTPGLEVWAEWLVAAVGKDEYLAAIQKAGFRDIRILTERAFSSPAMADPLAGRIVHVDVGASR